jgi:hypothetical protein
VVPYEFAAISIEEIAGYPRLSGLIETIEGKQAAVVTHGALREAEQLASGFIIQVMEEP